MKELHDILGLRSDPAPGPAAARREPVAGAQSPPPSPAALQQTRLQRGGYGLLALLAACATAFTPWNAPDTLSSVITDEQRALSFSLAAPDRDDLGAPLQLWATHYHTPSVMPAASDDVGNLALLDRRNQPISPPLTRRDWCEAVLQGSVSVRQGETSRAFVYIDSRGPEQTTCDVWMGNLPDSVKSASRKARFMEVSYPLGCEARDHPLVPLRTIAVDPATIPLGAVLFVPELRGRRFRVEGLTQTHDGYLVAGDRGGAIRGTHVDVFIPEDEAFALEDLFASTPGRTFSAHLVAASHPGAAALLATQQTHCRQNGGIAGD